MEVEHTVRVFPLDQALEGNIQGMTSEGWIMVPGITPIVVYHVVRMKGVTAAPEDGAHKPIAKLNIDDTKVHILRDGKLIDGSGAPEG